MDILFCNPSLGNGKEVRTWHNFVIFAYLNYIMNFSKVNVRDLAKAKYEDTYLLTTNKLYINVNLKMYSFDHLRMYNIDHINTCCSRW